MTCTELGDSEPLWWAATLDMGAPLPEPSPPTPADQCTADDMSNKPIDMPRRQDARGFRIYYDKETITVTEASVALQGPHVWVSEDPPVADRPEYVRLSVSQALDVIRALSAWVDDAIHDRLTEPLRRPLEGGDVCPRCERKLEEE